MDLTAYNRNTNAYLYKVNSGWEGFFADPATETASGRNYVDIDEKGYVTWKDGADVKEFAKAALAWAKGNNVPEVASKVADATNGTNKQEEEGKLPTYTLTFADLPLGYYKSEEVPTRFAIPGDTSDTEYLCGYTVEVESVPSGYTLTRAHVADDADDYGDRKSVV